MLEQVFRLACYYCLLQYWIGCARLPKVGVKQKGTGQVTRFCSYADGAQVKRRQSSEASSS